MKVAIFFFDSTAIQTNYLCTAPLKSPIGHITLLGLLKFTYKQIQKKYSFVFSFDPTFLSRIS